jgi:hypothetical protein
VRNLLLSIGHLLEDLELALARCSAQGVEAGGSVGEELGGAGVLDNLAGVEHQDLVEVDDGAKAMSDDEESRVGELLANRLRDLLVGLYERGVSGALER